MARRLIDLELDPMPSPSSKKKEGYQQFANCDLLSSDKCWQADWPIASLSTWLVSIGLILPSLSFVLMMTVTLTTAVWVLMLWAIVGRIGRGFILPSLNLGALRPLDKGQLSQGASSINFLRMLGGAIGVSLCGIVLEWRMSAHGVSLTQGASSPARLAAFNESFMMLAAICALALLASWRLRETPVIGGEGNDTTGEYVHWRCVN